MSQRYTPTKVGMPIFDDVAVPMIMTEAGAFIALEFNTLFMVSEFSNAGASVVIVPWILIKGRDGAPPSVASLWTPLSQVSLVAGAAAPTIAPSTVGYFKSIISQVEIPPCHAVRLELVSITGGNVKVWAGLTNRAPR